MKTKIFTLLAILLLAMPMALACFEDCTEEAADVFINDGPIVLDKKCLCPFESGEGKIVVSFSGVRIRTDSTHAKSISPVIATDIPAGNYRITLVSSDGYSGRENVMQPNEQWHLALGAQNSGMSTDLKDYIKYTSNIEIVNDNLYIQDNLTGVQAVHSFYPNTRSANSLYPICALFEPLPDDDVPEFGLVAGLLATAGIVGFVWYRRK